MSRNGKRGKHPPAGALVRSAGARVVPGARKLSSMRHPVGGSGTASWQFFPVPDPAMLQALDNSVGRFNYAGVVGDGLDSSAVSAALCWKMRTFPDAPAVVQEYDEGAWQTLREAHGNSSLSSLIALLRKPNPYYGPRVLWMSTCLDFAFGEAYWIKIRNVIGDVVQLWYVPRALMTPRAPSDGSEFISHYEYRTGGEPTRLLPRDVVHFRFGMDPQNIRRGFSPLAACVREVYTDEQAASFTASILRNLGIVGIIISPKIVEGSPASAQEDVQEVRDYIDANFTGERRGKTLAVGSPTEAQLLQYNLQGFDVGPIRDITEERVSAAMGIPAAVIGFGAGLQQTKVGATMKELVALAWEACLIPEQKIMGEALSQSLEDDFGLEPASTRVGFDLTEVTAVWEDELKSRGERVSKLFTSGVIKRGEARRALGLETDPKDDIYVLPSNVAPEGSQPPPTPPPADGGAGAGGDGGDGGAGAGGDGGATA